MSKILLVPEFAKFGGTRSYFVYLLNFLYKCSFDVAIVLTKCQLDEEIESLINYYGYKIYFIPGRVSCINKYFNYFPLNLLVDPFIILPIYLKEKPDLIVVSNGTPGMFISLILFPTRFLYIFHTYPLKSKIIGLSAFQKVFLSFLVGQRKQLLTVSEYSKKQILKHWVTSKKEKYINVIHNSINLNKFNTAFPIDENIESYIILTLGTVTWYKNPMLWIKVSQEVIRRRPDINIEFIWAGDGDLLEECKCLTDQLGLDSVKFIGYCHDVESLYRTTTIYFQPSLLESHGLSVLEAMAHGIPCVTSNVGGLPESVVNGQTGFTCPPYNIECFVSKIISLIDGHDIRYKMGHSGKMRAKNIFSKEVQEKKMINLYMSLLKK